MFQRDLPHIRDTKINACIREGIQPSNEVKGQDRIRIENQ
jgi:hypothetical protein